MNKKPATPIKRGRPPMPDSEKLTRQVKINLNESQIRMVHEAAKDNSIPVAKWLRDAVLKELGKE